MNQTVRYLLAKQKILKEYWRKHSWLGATLGFLLFGWVFYYFSEGLWQVLVYAKLWPLAFATFVSMLLFPIASLRWYLVARLLCDPGAKIGSYTDFLRIRVLASAIGLIGARELVELGGRTAWMAKNPAIGSKNALKIAFVDRVADLYFSGLCFVGALAYWVLGTSVFSAAAMVIVIPMVGIIALWGLMRLQGFRQLPLVRTTVEKLFTEGTESVKVLALSALKYILLVVRVGLTLWALDAGLSIWQTLVSVPIGQAAYLIAITPGSLGIYELSWVLILQEFLVNGPVILAFAILLRGLVLFSSLWLLPFLFLWRRSLEDEYQ